MSQYRLDEKNQREKLPPIRFLAASDVDGTLLPYGEKKLPPELFDWIRRARMKGVAFAAASGRDYSGLRRLFEEAADEIYFIATNGAQIFYHDELVAEDHIPGAMAEALAHDIERRGAPALVSTKTESLVRTSEPEFFEFMKHFGNKMRMVEDFSSAEEPIVKLAAYFPEGAAAEKPYFAERWEEDFRIAVAGPCWLDFNMTDKGTALALLSRKLGLGPESVWAFGDQQNDRAMLDYAGHAFLMQDAEEELKQGGYQLTSDVLAELESLLRSI